MTKSVFFGNGVVALTTLEYLELRRIYEQPILEKLTLGKKFPRAALFLHKNALGIGLMTPETITEILALKFYFGHTRLEGNINDLITAELEKLQVECGMNVPFATVADDEKWWPRTWLDRVFSLCLHRNIQVEREINFLKEITSNKTIMDYAIMYKKTAVTLGRINQVRLYKKLLLPLELVGVDGKQRTSCALMKHERSHIGWSFMQNDLSVPQRASWTTWNKFLSWLAK